MYLLNKRRVIALGLSLLMCFGLAACSGDPSGSAQAEPKKTIKKAEASYETEKDWAKGKAVKAFDNSYSIKENNLTTETVNDGNINYIVISGLKDKTVCDAINAEIKETAYGLSIWDEEHIPKARGIAVKAADYNLTTPKNTYTYTSTNFNCANILSLMIYSSASFDNLHEEYNDLYLSKVACLNYDLNTGKQIKLADTVLDGEGIEFFNKAMQEALIKSDSLEEDAYSFYSDTVWFKQAGEFPGFSEDQPFYIEGYSGDITLMLDYRNPWVQLSGNTASYTISLGEASALSQRFAGGSLFEDETPVYRILSANDFDAADIVDENINENYQGSENLWIYEEYRYAKSMPKVQIAGVYGDRELIQNAKDELLAVYSNYTDEAKRYLRGSFNVYGHASRIGEFTTVACNIYSELYDTRDWQSLYNYSNTEYGTYRGNSTTPLEFKDLFKYGTDPEALLTDAMVKQFYGTTIVSDDELQEMRAGIDEARLREFIGELLDAGFGFSITYDSLWLEFDNDTMLKLIYEYFPEFNGNIWPVTSSIDYISYKNLGCENLTIF